MRRSWMIVGALCALSSLGQAQAWKDSYEGGLRALKAGSFAEARKLFKQAVAYRPEDVSGATMLPGPPSEQRKWRDGAPYSPNFLGAYASYRAALVSGDEKNNLFNEAGTDLEALVAKRQHSYETFYFLSAVYNNLNRTEKRLQLEQTYAALNGKVDWKVDTEGLNPEEIALINQSYRNAPVGPTDETSGTPIFTNPNTPVGTNSIGLTGRVPVLSNKYALVIGNTASKMENVTIPFASDDAQFMRDTLVMSMGYAEDRVDLVLNATAAQIAASAKALADRMPNDATVFIYFSGAGANLGGKDYLAGVDTAMGTDSSTMMSKEALYKIFMAKGASIFSFYQVNRPVVEGRYFGMEVPMFGVVSQTQATLPGGSVSSLVRGGRQIGVFTDAIANVATDLRSNRLPILEFGWQIFYKMRRGSTGTEGGSGSQTPTLPVLTNMSSDARF